MSRREELMQEIKREIVAQLLDDLENTLNTTSAKDLEVYFQNLKAVGDAVRKSEGGQAVKNKQKIVGTSGEAKW